MNKKKFISQMQKKVAITSVGSSVVRGQPKGTIDTVREFLGQIRLDRIPKNQFQEWLNRQTRRMTNKPRKESIPWGVARKSLNLFLRDALYNRYLHTEYRLGLLEQTLEVPLDGVVGRHLIRKQEVQKLSAWLGLKHLTKEQNQDYQEVAAELAHCKKVARVHLDIFVWPNNR